MPPWDSQQYLRFERERTLPCRELVRRLELERPARIVDLGCGPGNSTAELAARWPGAEISGVDSSPAMLEAARASPLRAEWVLSDLRAFRPSGGFDLVFSNAALQWVPDHAVEVPRLWSWVRPKGALAFQVPAPGPERDRWTDPLEELLGESSWRDRVASAPTPESVLSPGEYYRLLSGEAAQVELWDTLYVHVLRTPREVVEWAKGTALRPILERLPSDAVRDEFLARYATAIEAAYPPEPDGRVLFPFLRRFVVAYRL